MAQLFKTEIVTGTCPTCNEKTLLVGIANSYYRCSACSIIDIHDDRDSVPNANWSVACWSC